MFRVLPEQKSKILKKDLLKMKKISFSFCDIKCKK